MRFAKNTLAHLTTHALTIAASFVLTAVIARTGGVETLGRYSSVLVFTTQLAFLCDLGLSMLLVPRTARSRADAPRLLTNSLALSLPLSLATFAAIPLLARLLGYAPEVFFPLALAGVWMILGVLVAQFAGVFYGLQHMEYNTLAVLVEKLVVLAGIGLILAARAPSLEAFLVLLIVSRGVALAVSAGLYARLKLGWGAIDPGGFKALLVQALPFGLNILVSSIYLQSDVVLLTFFRGETAVGYYKAANTFFFPLIVVASALNNALLPILSSSHGTREDRSSFLMQKSFHYLFALGFPMAVGLYIIAPSLLPATLGAEFAPAVAALRLLCWTLPLRFVNQTGGMVLTSINQQGQRTRAVALGAGFNLLANAIALPLFGFMGAALTTLLTEAVIFGLIFSQVSRRVSRPPFWATAWRVALASLVIVGVAWVLGAQGWVATIALAPVAYGLALFGLGGIPRADLDLLLATVRRPVAKAAKGNPRWS